MNAIFKIAFHPTPEVEKYDTGLRYTDVLFGFVIRELFLRLQTQNWTQITGEVQWHLIAGTTLVLGSWIGYRRSLYRLSYQLKFFNLPLFKFIVDQAMLILYFRLATLTDQTMKSPLPAGELAKDTVKFVMYVFVLYLSWDLLGVWMARAKIKGTHGVSEPLYPALEGPNKTNKEQVTNWVGLWITVAGLILIFSLWMLAECFNPILLLLITTVMLLAYRWAKEIRTSCQSFPQTSHESPHFLKDSRWPYFAAQS